MSSQSCFHVVSSVGPFHDVSATHSRHVCTTSALCLNITSMNHVVTPVPIARLFREVFRVTLIQSVFRCDTLHLNGLQLQGLESILKILGDSHNSRLFKQ